MTVRQKLRIGTLVNFIVFLLFAVVFYLQSRWIERSVTQVTEAEAPKNEAASRMEVDMVGMGFELLGYLQDHDPARIKRIEDHKNDFREYQSVYCRLAKTPEAELSAFSVDKDSALLGKIIEELINLEDYQVQRLTLLYENFDKINEILSEGFKAHSGPEGQGDYKKLETVMEMKSKADEIRRNLNSYLTTHEGRYENSIYQEQGELDMLAGVYKDLHVASKHRQWFERFNNIYAENLSLVKEVIALDGSKRVRLQEFVKTRENLGSVLGNNFEKARANFEDAKRASYMAISISTTVMLILLFVGLIVVWISQVYVAHLVARPITKLQDTAARISGGQYETRIEIESDDEIGQLAESISRMAEDLKRFKALSKQASEREEAGVSA